MAVDEAVLQLDGSRREFVVFWNAASETLDVIHRGKDGKHGFIEPGAALR